METPLTGFDFKFAKLPTVNENFDSIDAETMGWGAIETGGSKIFPYFVSLLFRNRFKIANIYTLRFFGHFIENGFENHDKSSVQGENFSI